MSDRAADLLRKRAALRMLVLAADEDPGLTWGGMVRRALVLATRLGTRIDLHPADVRDLYDVRVGELFDLGRHRVPADELRSTTIRREPGDQDQGSGVQHR